MFPLDHAGELSRLTLQHVKLSGTAVAIACCISIPLGIIVSRFGHLKAPILTIAGILFTIPSLALFAALIPVTGLGASTAIIALVFYSILAILRNTIAGIASVDPTTLDAARGMGMTSLQRLYFVELPLGLPVIITGIRAALVSTIGITTIAAYIGAGGLGELIFAGIRREDMSRLVTGAIATALLAILADLTLAWIEGLLRRERAPKLLRDRAGT